MKYNLILCNKDNFKGIDITKTVYLILILIIFLITSLLIMDVREDINYREELIETVTVKELDKFTPKKLKSYLKEVNIKFPEIVYAQAVEETGHFSSEIFFENSNLFGMKLAKQRAYTYIGENRGHALYNHWKESVLDYALFQSSYLRGIKTEKQYFEYLDKNYAEKPNYSDRLKKIIKNIIN